MPLYEFLCGKCGSKFDKIVSFSSVGNVVCQSCNSSKVEKLVSSFGVGGSLSSPKQSESSGHGGCADGGCCGGGRCG